MPLKIIPFRRRPAFHHGVQSRLANGHHLEDVARIEVGILHGPEQFVSAARLRHQVFCEELAWVSGRGGEERDGIDGRCVALAASRGDSILGYLRLVRGTDPYMVDRCFAHLLGGGAEPKRGADAAEISRLCVRSDARRGRFASPAGPMPLSMFLYRAAYGWCREEGVRHVCFITTPRVARLLALQGFPLKVLARGEGNASDQVLSQIDWQGFESQARCRGLVEWFTGSRGVPAPMPSRSPGRDWKR